ncbi:MAG: NDMA-dependent alcohol dehydrogenase [Acidimicrobiales bacterium]|jgi:S-(hydroxymethyl)glutathione dehydrogenase/alcohol dehydrogenase|nr:NDMA-dependent alcohol dehydrogenase [Acidimicrobiales bacterium]
MKTRAAVLHEVNADWSVEEIDLDPPKAGEVLVKLASSGLCYSDEHLRKGEMMPDPATAELLGLELYPIIGGHEGAGEVLEVGPGVTSVVPGDHVALSFVPSCGRCPSCASGHSNLCDLGAILLAGKQLDFTSRHHTHDGTDCAIMCCLGTFSEVTVVNEASVIKIEDDIPLQMASLVGCGVTTGWGSAVYAADVQPGETVMVIGAGGVGVNAVQGAAMAGARHVVVVDPVEFKRESAMNFGATHAVANLEEAFALVNDITWGQLAKKAIITTDDVDGASFPAVFQCVSKGGRVVLTAVDTFGKTEGIQMNLFDLTLQQKQLVGAIFGAANPRYDIPRLLRLYVDGKLKLDELVTKTYKLDEINQGYADLRAGQNIRGMVVYD